MFAFRCDINSDSIKEVTWQAEVVGL